MVRTTRTYLCYMYSVSIRCPPGGTATTASAEVLVSMFQDVVVGRHAEVKRPGPSRLAQMRVSQCPRRDGHSMMMTLTIWGSLLSTGVMLIAALA